MLDDFVGDESVEQFHVLEAFHWRAVVDFFDVKHHEFGIGSGQGAVEETLDGCEAGTLGGGNARIIELISTTRDTATMDFILAGTDCGHVASLGALVVVGHLVAVAKTDGVGTF